MRSAGVCVCAWVCVCVEYMRPDAHSYMNCNHQSRISGPRPPREKRTCVCVWVGMRVCMFSFRYQSPTSLRVRKQLLWRCALIRSTCDVGLMPSFSFLCLPTKEAIDSTGCDNSYVVFLHSVEYHLRNRAFPAWEQCSQYKEYPTSEVPW